MLAASRILALLGLGLAAAAAPVSAQGPLARTNAAHGFAYIDAFVGRAMAGIAQDRLLEAWGELQRAKRYDDDPARKAAVEELMQGIEVTSRLASYAAFLAGTRRGADAAQVTEWTGRFRATLYPFSLEESGSRGFAPHEVLKKYAAELHALGRPAEAIQTEALADAYRGHQMENWRRQREQYEKDK